MKHPPYHLRINKSVDRLLLVDAIRALGPALGVVDFSEFTYHTLAGPFLEDLRVMTHFFPEMQMISIESDEQTHKRQLFNKFCSNVQLRKVGFSDYLYYDYEPGDKDIFWLDYTDLKYRRFTEFQQVLRAVCPPSVVRITLRAEPDIDMRNLKDKISETEYFRLLEELISGFRDEFSAVLPSEIDLTEAFSTPSHFVLLVQGMVKRSASAILDSGGSEIDFYPLQCTCYSDNTQMISVTGIVCLRSEFDRIRGKLQSMRFPNFDWHPCEKIDIPALTIKERLKLEALLPIQDGEDAGERLYAELGYMIDGGEKRSKDRLSHYAECHRIYPNFIQISI